MRWSGLRIHSIVDRAIGWEEEEEGVGSGCQCRSDHGEGVDNFSGGFGRLVAWEVPPTRDAQRARAEGGRCRWNNRGQGVGEERPDKNGGEVEVELKTGRPGEIR